MIEPYYFEIPVYRCSQDIHTKEMKFKENKIVKEEWKEIAPVSYQNSFNLFHSKLWYPWKYNEIIGWICLYIMGSQIRGEYYFVNSKRIGKGIRKKKFENYGKAFEHSLSRDLTSKEIFLSIIDQLEKIKKDVPFKNRYIDTETFKIIGQFVDWKILVEKLNSFKYPTFKRNK